MCIATRNYVTFYCDSVHLCEVCSISIVGNRMNAGLLHYDFVDVFSSDY